MALAAGTYSGGFVYNVKSPDPRLTTDDIRKRLNNRGVLIDDGINNNNFPLARHRQEEIDVGIISVGPTKEYEWKQRLLEAGLDAPLPEHAVWFINRYSEKGLSGGVSGHRFPHRQFEEPFILFPHKPIDGWWPYSSDEKRYPPSGLVLCVSFFPSVHEVFLRSTYGGFTGAFRIAGVVPQAGRGKPNGWRPY